MTMYTYIHVVLPKNFRLRRAYIYTSAFYIEVRDKKFVFGVPDTCILQARFCVYRHCELYVVILCNIANVYTLCCDVSFCSGVLKSTVGTYAWSCNICAYKHWFWLKSLKNLLFSFPNLKHFLPEGGGRGSFAPPLTGAREWSILTLAAQIMHRRRTGGPETF